MTPPAFVRCKDASLVRATVQVGRVYQVQDVEQYNYRINGVWMLKGRFEPATYEDWMSQQGEPQSAA